MITTYEADLYTDDPLDGPYPHYRTLRQLGSVVRPTAHDVLAVTRYDEARAVVGDGAASCSGQGVGLDDVINRLGRGTTLMTDGGGGRRPPRGDPRRGLPRAFRSVPVRVESA